eukprot:scaffold1284_cov108-Cylindrotheca_fusiformis.AAC.34
MSSSPARSWGCKQIKRSKLPPAAIANFGVSLAKLVDPLGAHRGSYEGTPIEFEYTRDRLVEIAKEMDTDLWWSALRALLFILGVKYLLRGSEENRDDDYDDGDDEVTGA